MVPFEILLILETQNQGNHWCGQMSRVKEKNKYGVVECSGKAPRTRINTDNKLAGWKALLQWRDMGRLPLVE